MDQFRLYFAGFDVFKPDCQPEAVEHIVCPLQHRVDHLPGVLYADVGIGITAQQPVAANKAELSRQQLEGARASVRVQHDDFVGLGTADLRGVAQHVFAVFAVAHFVIWQSPSSLDCSGAACHSRSPSQFPI